MIRVLICDDQEIVAHGIRMIVSSAPDIEVSGIAHNGAKALELMGERKPDLVMMDLQMPIMNGVYATQQIRVQYPDVSVLVLTTFKDDDWLFDAVRAGAAGYLLKDTPPDELIAAVRSTVNGGNPVDDSVAGTLLR
ncbi:MAG: response regulator transcription factor, partial [Chloroflexota bacterium]